MPVYREKNKEKWTKDGRSYYFKCYYTDSYGKRKQYESKLYKLSGEAKDAEREFLNRINTKDLTDYSVSFETVYNEWLSIKKRLVKSTTFYSLNKSLNKHILTFFKEYKLHSVKINKINEWYHFLDSQSTTEKHKNLMISYLKEILTYAKDNYDFDPKVVSKIQKKRIEISDEKLKDAEWNFWTNEEFNRFIKIVDDPLYNKIFTFLYYTGLRLGEMIALTWNDIDLNRKELYIRHNFTNKLGNGKYEILLPKTKNSIRTIHLDRLTANMMKEHYNQEQRIYNFSENMFIFGNQNPIRPTTFARKLNNYIEIAHVKKITPHGFRHSHASLLIDLGCDSREVANRLGDTVQIVEKTYYHMFPQKAKNTVIAIDKLRNKEVNKR